MASSALFWRQSTVKNWTDKSRETSHGQVTRRTHVQALMSLSPAESRFIARPPCLWGHAMGRGLATPSCMVDGLVWERARPAVVACDCDHRSFYVHNTLFIGWCWKNCPGAKFKHLIVPTLTLVCYFASSFVFCIVADRFQGRCANVQSFTWKCAAVFGTTRSCCESARPPDITLWWHHAVVW